MPNLSRLLKDEIARLSRKEIRAQTAALHRAVAVYRREIAALKRRDLEMQRAIQSLSRSAGKSEPSPTAEATDKLRFRADGFRTLRKKLDLSAEQVGLLLNVSGQSVYSWEQKRAIPRRSQLPAIAALRGMGKREVQRRLAELKAGGNVADARTARRKHPRNQVRKA